MTSTPFDYVMVHLAYTLGLRPCEICRITLNDIASKKEQVTVAGVLFVNWPRKIKSE